MHTVTLMCICFLGVHGNLEDYQRNILFDFTLNGKIRNGSQTLHMDLSFFLNLQISRAKVPTLPKVIALH